MKQCFYYDETVNKCSAPLWVFNPPPLYYDLRLTAVVILYALCAMLRASPL